MRTGQSGTKRNRESAVITIKPSKPADASELLPRLRPEDLKELTAVVEQKERLEEALRNGITMSKRCYTVRFRKDKKLICVFGVVDDPYIDMNAGAVWMLGTPSLTKISITFLKRCKEFIKILEEGYEMTHNLVHCENKLHIKWLEWAGFTFIRENVKVWHKEQEFF